MADNRHVQHIRSSVVENGKAKLPSSDALYYGEIAINYAKGYETISLKNNSGDVVTFSSDANNSESYAAKEHTHAHSAITDWDAAVENTVVSSSSVTNRVESIITSAITNNESVSASVETVISAFTDNTLDDRYAFKEHTHKASAITDFDSAVEGVVATSTTITDRIETVVASAITNNESVSASVETVISAFTDSTLDDKYAAKSHKHDTSDINGLNDAIADAIENNDAVISAITEILSSDSGITEVINNVVSGQIDSAVSGKVNTSDYTAFTSSTETALGKKFEGVNYVKNDNKIYFYNNASNTGTPLASIDTSDFIVDGMVDSVELESKSGSTYLVITWNTAAGSTVTELNIGDIFEADNYYTTGETDTKFLAKADADSVIASAITNNNTVKNDVISAVTASTEFTTLTGNVNTLSGTVTAHTANTEIHVTTAQTASWDAKSDFSGNYEDLSNIPTAFTPTKHTHPSSDIVSMSGYTKQSTASAIATGDTLNVAIGKLEKAIDDATAGGVTSVSLTGGTNNGTLKLTVNLTETDNIAVTGLGTAAYKAEAYFASSSHTHTSGDITNFSSAVESVVSTSTTVQNRVESIIASAVTASTTVVNSINSAITSNTIVQNISGDVQTLSGKVETISGDVQTLSGSVSGATAMANFLTGHNTSTSLTNIPTSKRLVIATVSSAVNNFSVSGGTSGLADGYELHIIVNNSSASDITIATTGLQTPYKVVGNDITIVAGSYGEINVISDGTTLYVRGA